MMYGRWKYRIFSKAKLSIYDRFGKKFFIQKMFLNLIGMVFIWEERFHQILIGMF
jgi:hypothetical protein